MEQKSVIIYCDGWLNSLHRELLVLLVLLVSLDLVDLPALKELLDLSGPKEHLYVITEYFNLFNQRWNDAADQATATIFPANSLPSYSASVQGDPGIPGFKGEAGPKGEIVSLLPFNIQCMQPVCRSGCCYWCWCFSCTLRTNCLPWMFSPGTSWPSGT